MIKMNVLDKFSHGDRPMCQKWYVNVKANRSLKVGHEDITKTYKFNLEVKGQHRIGVMNVRNTSSYEDTSMCQIW